VIPAYVHLRRAKDQIDRRFAEPLDVGFTSIGSFGTAFRALMGEPPSAYRDRHRGAPPPQVPACFTLMWTRPVDRAVSEKPDREESPIWRSCCSSPARR
jgi:hypothetical protein